MPNPAETATLIVAGRKFEDWESVWVQIRWTESYPIFRFTCAEREPIPNLWTKLQFKPGDFCDIMLAGQKAITGVILERQVAYDATSHMVQLTGVGMTYGAARSSVHPEKNFDGDDFETVARKVLKPYNVGIEVVGQLSKTPFKELQAQPGENVWDFLERLARVRRIVIGSNAEGQFVLIGDHTGKMSQQLIEGINILKMQCILSIKEFYDRYIAQGQNSSHDESHGRETKEIEAEAEGKRQKFRSDLVTPAEQPVTQAEMPERAASERQWHEYTDINATVTVQGWLRDGRELWKVGDNVKVKSPMAILDHVLKIKTATFTQDSPSGTLTTLECVNPRLLNDQGWNVGNPGITNEMPAAKSTYWRSPDELPFAD